MESNKNKVSNQQLAAKKYIEENEIERVISEMLNSLVHEKSKQPLVYMIKYLAGLLTEDERKQSGLGIPEPFPNGKPIPRFPDFQNSNPNCLTKKHLTKSVWSQIKYNRSKHEGTAAQLTKLSGAKSQDSVGCVFTDSNCLNTFNPFLGPLMVELHKYQPTPNDNLPETEKFRPSRVANIFNSQGTNDNFPLYERISNKVENLMFSFSRNLYDTPFPAILTKEKRASVENTILKAVNQMLDDKILSEGNFFNFKDNENELNSILPEYEIDLDLLEKAGMKEDWPSNRQIFITKDRNLVIFINFFDHLKIATHPKQAEGASENQFTRAYNESINLIKSFEKYLQFDYDKYYGYINSFPILIGAGLSLSCRLKLENLTKISEFSNKLSALEFDSVSIEGSDVYFQKFYKLSYESDMEFCEAFYNKISGLINLDRGDEYPEWINMPCLSLSESPLPALKKAYESNFETLKNIFSVSGRTINSIVKIYSLHPNILPAILFSESYEYKTFSKFVRDYIFFSQNFDLDAHDHIYKPDEQKNSDALQIKEHAGRLLSTKVSLVRNIRGYPFACSKQNKNSEVFELVSLAVEKMKMKNINGELIHINSEEYIKIKTGYNFDIFHSPELEKIGLLTDFPQNRAIYQFDKDNIFAIINDFDHLKLKIVINDDKLQAKFIKLLKICNEFSKSLSFIYDKHLGFLTAFPDYLGSGMVTRSKLKLTNLIHDEEKLRNITEQYEFSYKIDDRDQAIVEIQNKYTVGRSEIDLLGNLICLINKLIEHDNL